MLIGLVKMVNDNRRILSGFFEQFEETPFPVKIDVKAEVGIHGALAFNPGPINQEGVFNQWIDILTGFLNNRIFSYQDVDPLGASSGKFWDAIEYFLSEPIFPTKKRNKEGSPIQLQFRCNRVNFEIDIKSEWDSKSASCNIYAQHTDRRIKRFLPEWLDKRIAPIKQPLEDILEGFMYQAKKRKILNSQIAFFFDEDKPTFRPHCEFYYFEILQSLPKDIELYSRSFNYRVLRKFTEYGSMDNAPYQGQVSNKHDGQSCEQIHMYPAKSDSESIFIHGTELCDLRLIKGVTLNSRKVIYELDHITHNTIERVGELVKDIYEQSVDYQGRPDEVLDKRSGFGLVNRFEKTFGSTSFWDFKPYLFQLVVSANLKKENGQKDPEFTGRGLVKKLERIPLDDFLWKDLQTGQYRNALETYMIHPVDFDTVGLKLVEKTVDAMNRKGLNVFCSSQGMIWNLPMSRVFSENFNPVHPKHFPEILGLAVNIFDQTERCWKGSSITEDLFNEWSWNLFRNLLSPNLFLQYTPKDLLFYIHFIDKYRGLLIELSKRSGHESVLKLGAIMTSIEVSIDDYICTNIGTKLPNECIYPFTPLHKINDTDMLVSVLAGYLRLYKKGYLPVHHQLSQLNQFALLVNRLAYLGSNVHRLIPRLEKDSVNRLRQLPITKRLGNILCMIPELNHHTKQTIHLQKFLLDLNCTMETDSGGAPSVEIVRHGRLRGTPDLVRLSEGFSTDLGWMLLLQGFSFLLVMCFFDYKFRLRKNIYNRFLLATQSERSRRSRIA